MFGGRIIVVDALQFLRIQISYYTRLNAFMDRLNMSSLRRWLLRSQS